MKYLNRRTVLAGTFATAGTARAEDRPLRIVVGFPPGAGIDTIARLIADKMHTSLGRPVIVENKPGAAGMIANTTVKAAAPDGNTLLMTPLANMVFFPHSYAKLDYDPFKDYAPVAHLASFPLAFGVGSARAGEDARRVRGVRQEGRRQRQLHCRVARQPAAFLRPDVRQDRRASSSPTSPTRAPPRPCRR